MQVTPHLPPVSPNEVQPDAYELMRKAFESREVTDFVSEGGDHAHGTRAAVGENLSGETLDFCVPGYADAGKPEETPSEREDMKVRSHAEVSSSVAG